MANTTISLGGYSTPSFTSSNTSSLLLDGVAQANVNFNTKGTSVSYYLYVPSFSSINTSSTTIEQFQNSTILLANTGVSVVLGSPSPVTVPSTTRLSTFIQTAADPFGAPSAPSSQYWYMS